LIGHTKNELVLLAINHTIVAGKVCCEFLSNGEKCEFLAQITDSNGLRTLRFSEELDSLLKSYAEHNPFIEAASTCLTWHQVGGKAIRSLISEYLSMLEVQN
jgi:hypothetical protein